MSKSADTTDPRGDAPKPGGTHHGQDSIENTCPLCGAAIKLLPNHLPECPGESDV